MASSSKLQFDHAHYDGELSPLLHCAYCGRSIAALRFEIYGRPTCDFCGRAALAQLPADTTRTFVRSVGYGTLAVLAAGFVITLVERLSPISYWQTIAIFGAILLGLSIAHAMRAAGAGARGRRYQLTGALLAYAGIVFPLQSLFMGTRQEHLWLYPLVLLQPTAFLFTDLRYLGARELFAAFVAAMWTWRNLSRPPTPIRELPPDPSVNGKRSESGTEDSQPGRRK